MSREGRVARSAFLNLHELVLVMARPEYIKNQGAAAPRPTPMNLFRQRYGLPSKR